MGKLHALLNRYTTQKENTHTQQIPWTSSEITCHYLIVIISLYPNIHKTEKCKSSIAKSPANSNSSVGSRKAQRISRKTDLNALPLYTLIGPKCTNEPTPFDRKLIRAHQCITDLFYFFDSKQNKNFTFYVRPSNEFCQRARERASEREKIHIIINSLSE